LAFEIIKVYHTKDIEYFHLILAALLFSFVFAALVRMVMLTVDARSVVELTDEGLFVREIAGQPIPWRDIATVRVGRIRRSSFVELQLSPNAEKTLTFTRLTRFNRLANRIVEYRGYSISTTYLSISAEDLAKLIRDRIIAVGN
jgi:hypothetical protein